MRSQQKAQPLCGKPLSGIFTGHDKYLTLQELTVREQTAPAAEDDSLFVYVTSGSGHLTVNGVVFDLIPGSFCWLQSYHVFSFAPAWGSTLELQVLVYDYPLSSYMTYRSNQPANLTAFSTGMPIYHLSGTRRARVEELLKEFQLYSDRHSAGPNLIKCAILGQLSDLFVEMSKEYSATHTHIRHHWPLGWILSLFIAYSCAEDLDPKDVAESFGVSVPTLNRELRITTGMNFTQSVNRARINLAASAILFSELSFHFISTFCGFRSEVAFYRTFRELKGMTPQDYRDQAVSTGGVPRKMVSETVERILFYIHNNYREQISLKTMAQELYISENIIRTLLADSLNTNFKDILSAYRLRYAEAMLVVTDMPILDVSLASGFNSERTFTRLFKERNGVTPSAYRSQFLGESL